MKQKLLKLSLAFILPLGIYSQTYIGLSSDNYSGIHGVVANPANVVDSRFKFDFNLASLNAFVANDYVELNLFDSFDSSFDFDNDANLSISNDNNGAVNIDILGPSFMFNINPKNSIGITTRARGFANINNLNGEVIELFDEKLDENEAASINNATGNTTINLWNEIGLTYGRVLFDKEKHFLKGGITAKYLQGRGYASGEINNVNADYTPASVIDGRVDGELKSTGTAEYSYSQNLDLNENGELFENEDDYDFENVETTGFGFDLGFVYEYRPNHEDYKMSNKEGEVVYLKDENKYLFKVGLSVTDIGSLKYDDASTTNYDLNTTIDQKTIEDGDFEKDIEPLLSPEEASKSQKIKLPAAAHLNVDWKAYKKLYLNLNTDLSLINEDKEKANRISNNISLTPRLETKWFSIYSPLSIREYGGFLWGTGIRLGPLFVGSGSVLSNIITSTKTIDFYAGVKIPIYQGKLKDRDKDGIYDKYDECPKKAGPASNNGCPLPEVKIIDTDKDGIRDSFDKCPNEYGTAENKGCPKLKPVIKIDTDNDGIRDSFDKCPNEYGTAKNKGCPEPKPVIKIDTDNDGIEDRLDKCPNKYGTAKNSGCPDVIKETKKIEETLNFYAKTINFNSGKSSFKQGTLVALEEIVKILNKYPNANFSINGYTDSVGSESSNQRLSESRAYAVKAYLIEKGIDNSKLNATGYGEVNPIADNKTANGRELNRRVEIKLKNN